MGESEQLLLARCGGRCFALPLAQVVEVFELSQPVFSLPGAPGWVAGMLNHHGQVVLLVDAARLQGQSPSGGRQAVLLRLGGDPVGLVVDGVEAVSGASGPGGAPVLDTAALQRTMAESLAAIDGTRPA